jgi:Mg2+ and Co2+ transporter CorA
MRAASGEPGRTHVRARLYDARGRDRDIDLANSPPLEPHQLLWVDVRGLDAATFGELRDRFRLHDEIVEALGESRGRPRIDERGSYQFVRVVSASTTSDEARTDKIDCLVGDNWIATVHDAPVLTLELFDETVRAESMFGRRRSGRSPPTRPSTSACSSNVCSRRARRPRTRATCCSARSTCS